MGNALEQWPLWLLQHLMGHLKKSCDEVVLNVVLADIQYVSIVYVQKGNYFYAFFLSASAISF